MAALRPCERNLDELWRQHYKGLFAARHSGESLEARLAHARRTLEEGQYETARGEYRAILEECPQNREALTCMGASHVIEMTWTGQRDDKKIADAVTYLEHARAAGGRPDLDADILMYLGMAKQQALTTRLLDATPAPSPSDVRAAVAEIRGYIAEAIRLKPRLSIYASAAEKTLRLVEQAHGRDPQRN